MFSLQAFCPSLAELILMGTKLYLVLDYMRLVSNNVRKTKEKENTNGRTEKTLLTMGSVVFLKIFSKVNF